MCPQKAEHHLSNLQRQVRAMTISSDPRDRREMLTLPLLPTEILCANTGYYPLPQGACAARHCQGPEIQGQIPRENTWHASGCCNVMLASAITGSHRIPIMTIVPLPLLSLSEQESLNQLLL